MESLASGYGLIEAPRVDREGNVYFSDVLGGGVHRRAPDGTLTVVIPKRRGIGGLGLHADGGIVVSGRDVSHVRDGETRLLLALDGVVGFNDLTTDAAGRVFVGSLRTSAFETGSRVPDELWRIDGAGSAVEIYGGVEFANGSASRPTGARSTSRTTASALEEDRNALEGGAQPEERRAVHEDEQQPHLGSEALFRVAKPGQPRGAAGARRLRRFASAATPSPTAPRRPRPRRAARAAAAPPRSA